MENLFSNLSCNKNAAGGCMGKGMGDAASVADDIKTVIFFGHKVFVNFDFHVIEFNFNAIEKGVVVGGSGCNLIKCIDHLNDSVKDSLRKNKGKVAGGCVKGGGDECAVKTVLGGASSAGKISETLNDYAAAKHVGKFCNTFAIAVGIFERFGEMFGNKKSKVGVFGLLCRVFIAVSVNGDDSVGVFVNNRAFGVHAESSDKVAVFFGAVNDFTFIKFVGKMGENVCGKFNANTNINAVGLGGNSHFFANSFHPFASASANGNYAVFAGIGFFCGLNFVTAFDCNNVFNGGIEEEFDFVFKEIIDIFKIKPKVK